MKSTSPSGAVIIVAAKFTTSPRSKSGRRFGWNEDWYVASKQHPDGAQPGDPGPFYAAQEWSVRNDTPYIYLYPGKDTIADTLTICERLSQSIQDGTYTTFGGIFFNYGYRAQLVDKIEAE